MQDAGVRDLVRRVLEPHAENERMLDAYWQWASNPTPPSAGYALEENCGFIATNLLVRYERPGIDVVNELAAECRQMRQEASIHDLRHALVAVLGGELGQVLRSGIAQRLGQDSPERRLLSAWLVSRAWWGYQPGRDLWLAGEFDWSLGIDLEAAGRDLQTEPARLLYGGNPGAVDLPREALRAGIVNRLFYRNGTGRMEPKFRPGPRVPLSLIKY